METHTHTHNFEQHFYYIIITEVDACLVKGAKRVRSEIKE